MSRTKRQLRKMGYWQVALAMIVMATGTLGAAGATARRGPVPASEQRASRAFETARKRALTLHAFLERMPKGADLHMHLSGAVYAETFLREAAEDDMCLNPETLSLVGATGRDGVRAPRTAKDLCIAPTIPAKMALRDQELYNRLIDSWSMRGFVPKAGFSGHDQFFATFSKFNGLNSHTGDWLDEVASRAAAQNEQYLEIMFTPTFDHAARLGAELGWEAADTTPAGMGEKRTKLLAAIAEDLKDDQAQLTRAFDVRRAREHCGQPGEMPACAVEIRILYQVLRSGPPQRVFAQTLLGFELATADKRVVGLNFVQPEDDFVAMTEYHRQMLMLDYLHGVYPAIHISLHAGELAPGLVTPEDLRFHVREAVELGHAERIGHGVAVMYEDRPEELLREMAEKHVMVEINLTSNDKILGVLANEHSLPSYRAAGVPVALSTDDEGVSRIDLTHEYARAASEYGFSYRELKDIARTGLEHSFLPGASLWAAADVFTKKNRACAATSGADAPAAGCAEFLHSSEKAAQQWELERRFALFESSFR